MECPLVVLTGASGAGKTTLGRFIQEHHSATHDVIFFDSIGVPSIEQMEREYGSGEAWQRAMTIAWMERISTILSNGRPVLFEGQIMMNWAKYLREEALTTGSAVLDTGHIPFSDCVKHIRRYLDIGCNL